MSIQNTAHDKLCEIIRQNYTDFIEKLKQEPVESILKQAYEKAMKEDLVICVEEMYLTSAQSNALLSFDNPLEEIYCKLLSSREDCTLELQDSVERCIACAPPQLKQSTKRKEYER